jgi:hypothetical protein
LPDDSSDISLANKFGDFFIDKITRIRACFNDKNVFHCPQHHIPVSFQKFKPVTETDVHKLVMASPTKSCSLDPWPTFLLKDCIDILLPSLTRLVNLSLANGIFPNDFKKAVVTPLIKKASLSKNEFKNYRPVSGLCFISKLVERVVSAQLKEHVNSHNLGNIFQSAYKCGHSTETALLKIKNDIHSALACGMPTSVVLLDLSAAFDTIDHQILLDRLSSWFGLNGTVLAWFKSYLSDRVQSVKIGSTLSEPTTLKFGVPQGSVLGPILYSMYTSPLSNVISAYDNLKYHFYADDTQLYFHISPNSSKLDFAQLQSCLVDIQMWMTANMLKLNPDKTEFIVFGSEKQRKMLSNCFPIDILGNDLSPANKVKNLGVILDSGLSLSDHVSLVSRQCYVNLRDFRRIRRYLSKEVAISVANSLVSSRLDYCNSLFRSLSFKELHRLQCLQNAAARIVSNTSIMSHITPVLESLHWLPVKFRIIFKVLCITHKFINTGLPKYLDTSLVPYSQSVNTRRSDSSNLYLAKSSYDNRTHRSKVHFNCSLNVDAPGLWNELPLEIRTTKVLLLFRKKLKTFLFRKAFPP